MNYNKDELEAPDWVNADFAKKVIESSGEGKNVQIKNYKISPATALGDHFASIMFRVHVSFSADGIKTGSISLILKTFPVEDGLKKEMLSSDGMDLFKSEAYIYGDILNESKKMLNNCGYKELLSPRLLYHSMESPKVLVFEDLKEMGYIMLPHNIPDEHEVKLIYSKLAQYHATTFKMGVDGRKDLLNIKGTLFGFSFMKQFDAAKNGPAEFTAFLESLPGFEAYAKKMRSLTFEVLWGECSKLVTQPGPYSVLNHGDYHSRNMMFKKNRFDAISEVVLIDFQCPHWGSPAYDIIYLAAFIPWKLRELGYRHYFNVFTEVVVKLGYKGKLPIYEELLEHLKTYIYFDVFLMACSSVFMYMDRTQWGDDFEKLLSDSDARKVFYKNPVYVNYIKEVMPILLDAISID